MSEEEKLGTLAGLTFVLSPGQFKEYKGNLTNQINNLKQKINDIIEIINNLKPLSEEETEIKEMLKQAYSEDNIKNLEINFKTICHLEDFEIAIWNIKNILEGEENE